jgi:propanol-preferring alcohol dehydrogenase
MPSACRDGQRLRQMRFCMAGMETICKAGRPAAYTSPAVMPNTWWPAAFVAPPAQGADFYQLAPILCAGVTTYRGLKRTNTRPGQWMAVVGIGGLGHIAVQYAKAMGYRVAAVDVADDKLRLAKKLGAELTVNGKDKNAPQVLQDKIGGVDGAIVTAVTPQAFEQAIGMLRPAGTVCYISLAGGKKDEIRASISAITNWELSVRGSNVGTRLDLNEAVAFAANGLVTAKIKKAPLEQINAIFDEMRAGNILGRVVLKLA